MIAERTYDTDLIRSIALIPEIWDELCEDGQESKDFIPYTKSDCWLKMCKGNNVVGVFMFEKNNETTLQVHTAILPKYRGKISREAGKAHLKWVYENVPSCNKIVASIPTIRRHVKLYANMLGYKDEGLNRASFMKNGLIHDQWMLGITRDEIERRLT